MFGAVNSGFNDAGFSLGSGTYAGLKAMAQESERLAKSLTTGEGIVPAGDQTSAKPLRIQYLHNVLETVSFDQDDAGLFKLIPKEKVYSNTFEWSQFNAYGSIGDGFVGESGFDQVAAGTGGGVFSVNNADDTFTRLVRQIKFLAASRSIGIVASEVKNLEDPEKLAEEGMTRELIAKANLACYTGDSKKTGLQFDGFIRQFLDWLTPNSQGSFSGYPADTGIIYDAGGAPMDKGMLEDICALSRQKFGKIDTLIQSVQGLGDTQKSLFPESRYQEGQVQGEFGNDRRTFVSSWGRIRLVDDVMLRPNLPLAADGPAVTGLIRTTADVGSTPWASDPYVASSSTLGCQAVAAGAGNFWSNVALNTDAAALTTVPALPSGEGNQANRLPATTTYYAVSIVVGGKESTAWVMGASAANTVTGATALTSSASTPVNQLELLVTTITGIVSTYAKNQVRYRIYSKQGAAPVALSEFKFLCDAGTPAAGNVRVYDNGMYIAGSDNAFAMTSKRNGSKGFFWAQLLPLMKRTGLPEYIMGSPLAMLMFGAPIILVPKHHIWVRNIGRIS